MPQRQGSTAVCSSSRACACVDGKLHDVGVYGFGIDREWIERLCFDNIGHGKTTAPSNVTSSLERPAYHFDDMTRHVHQLVRITTGQDKVQAVMGCSMGGTIALRYGMLFPDAVLNCTVCCDAPAATSPEAAKSIWGQRIEQLRKDLQSGEATLCRVTAKRRVPGDDEQSLLARAQALVMTKTCSFDGHRICADGIRNYEYHDQLRNLKVRTLVLAGKEDSSIGPPEVTEATARAAPNAELVWMEATGYLPSLHRPAEFEHIILQFLGNNQRT